MIWFMFSWYSYEYHHYYDVIKTAMASQITGVSIVCSTVCSGIDQRKHQRSAPLTFVRGIHRWPSQATSYAENASIWWRLHVITVNTWTMTTVITYPNFNAISIKMEASESRLFSKTRSDKPGHHSVARWYQRMCVAMFQTSMMSSESICTVLE